MEMGNPDPPYFWDWILMLVDEIPLLSVKPRSFWDEPTILRVKSGACRRPHFVPQNHHILVAELLSG